MKERCIEQLNLIDYNNIRIKESSVRKLASDIEVHLNKDQKETPNEEQAFVSYNLDYLIGFFKKGGGQFKQIDFEKDDDTNGHVLFI